MGGWVGGFDGVVGFDGGLALGRAIPGGIVRSTRPPAAEHAKQRAKHNQRHPPHQRKQPAQTPSPPDRHAHVQPRQERPLVREERLGLYAHQGGAGGRLPGTFLGAQPLVPPGLLGAVAGD